MSTKAHSPAAAAWKPQGEVPVHIDQIREALKKTKPGQVPRQPGVEAGQDPKGMLVTAAIAGYTGD
jgi:hypothetical protein